MGSGRNNRKKNDAPFIRRPINLLTSGEVITDVPALVADKCVASFDYLVASSHLTVPGIPVQLRLRGQMYIMVIGATEIGSINSSLSKTIEECGQFGVKYSGIIVKKRNRTYARFTRK